jgi:peptidoglycan hydrolase-like protein with peptidoglycan-binding domain
MKKFLSVLLAVLFAFTVVMGMQNANFSTTTSNANSAKAKRKPPFRADKDQIKQAQALLKQRGFYTGEQTGKLDADMRAGLKKYQAAEKIKITGTLNRVTLEKMSIPLTEKQKAL